MKDIKKAIGTLVSFFQKKAFFELYILPHKEVSLSPKQTKIYDALEYAIKEGTDVVVAFYNKFLTKYSDAFWLGTLRFCAKVGLIIGTAIAIIMGREIIYEVIHFIGKTIGKILFNSVFGIVGAIYGLGSAIWKVWTLKKSIAS